MQGVQVQAKMQCCALNSQVLPVKTSTSTWMLTVYAGISVLLLKMTGCLTKTGERCFLAYLDHTHLPQEQVEEATQ